MELSEIASASALLKSELAPLAEKLGEGAEYTFELFVRQAYVNGVIALLALLGLLILGILLTLVWRKFHDEGDALFPLIAITFVYFFLGAIFLIEGVSTATTAFINPEYAAIKLIIETFIK